MGGAIISFTNFIVTIVGGIINYFVRSLLSATNGIKFFAVLGVVGFIALTGLYSIFGKAKFFPKDANVQDVQAREVQKALKTFKFPIIPPVKTTVKSFNERKLSYLQKPLLYPSVEV
jgi:hypothetical protein